MAVQYEGGEPLGWYQGVAWTPFLNLSKVDMQYQDLAFSFENISFKFSTRDLRSSLIKVK